MSFITVNELVKEYKIAIKKEGTKNALLSLFHREYINKLAIDHISFSIEQGETVGYIGANGAGKSTTIKILSGILTPTSGEVFVNGIVPYKNRTLNAKSIGVIFGQRSQMYWDLPVKDSFDMSKVIYQIPDSLYKKNYNRYIELFDMGSFINQPVRQLSLGQKMRANIAIALLHSPKVLYLDEPTIGLDIASKKNIRSCINELKKEQATTIILTTHDMDDIESTCNRIILIDNGKKRYDGSITSFRNKYSNGYFIKMEFIGKLVFHENENYKLVNREDNQCIIKCSSKINPKQAFTELINSYELEKIYLIEQTIESIIEDMEH